MAASSAKFLHRAIAVAFVLASVACADNALAPTPSAPTRGVLDKKVTVSDISARGFIDNAGNTLFEITTGNFDDVTLVPPGQLTHVHFKLCKEIEEAKGQPEEPPNPVKQFSANFHYQDKLYTDKEKDDEVDSPLDPDDKSAKFGRVNWDRSAVRSTIKLGGYSNFNFTGLLQGSRVEIKITYKLLKANYKNGSKPYDFDGDDYTTKNVTLCVPVAQAPNPSLAPGSGGDLSITTNQGGKTPSPGEPHDYVAHVNDAVGSANVRATCNFYVDGVYVSSAPVTIQPPDGGVCVLPAYSFATARSTPYIVSVRLSGIYPDDFDPSDNYAELPVIVSGMSDDGTVSVAAEFSALGTVQTVNVASNLGYNTVVAYNTNTRPSILTLPITSNFPTQATAISVTLFHSFVGPFDVGAMVSTSGSPSSTASTVSSLVGNFSIPALSLDPNALKGSTGLAPALFETCTPYYTVRGSINYSAQVCVVADPRPRFSSRNKTVMTFEIHSDMDANPQGWFVPFGNTLTFNTDLVASFGTSPLGIPSPRLHYRVVPQTLGLVTTTDGQPAPTCQRFPVTALDGVVARCDYFTGGSTTRAKTGDAIPLVPIIGTPN